MSDINKLVIGCSINKPLALEDISKNNKPNKEDIYIYWLLRAYQSVHRDGWENSPSVAETMQGLLDLLANNNYDPAGYNALKLMNRIEKWNNK